MPRRVPAILALLCVQAAVSFAADRNLQNYLNEEYVHRILFLRHAYMSAAQEYDPEGKLVAEVEEGPWSFYGSLKVKRIVLHNDKLQVEGARVIYKYLDEPAKHFVPVREAEGIKVTIRLTHPLISIDEAVALLGRIFASTQEEALASMPAELRPYFSRPGGSDTKNDENAHLEAERVYKLGPGITPPKLQFSPEPAFSPKALQHRFEGVVGLNVIVDSKGTVSSATVIHPLGMGLDEEAARTVKAWRFIPAKREGQPVAVKVYIEVDFHLYDK
jgi:TonB family protein